MLLAIPILLTTLSQMAYNLTDLFWIGKVDSIGLLETEAVAAVGTAGYLIWFGTGVTLIAKLGTSVRISHAVGKREPEKVNVFATNGLMLQLMFGVVFSVLTLVFTKQYLAIFHIQSAVIIAYAMDYIPIVGGFLFVQFLVHGFISINEGLGQTNKNLMILAIGFAINMILDPLFILVFRFGISGAAIATVLSQIVTLIIFYVVYHWVNPEVKAFHYKNVNMKAIRQIIKVGLPIGLQSIFFTVIAIYVARHIYAFGEEVVSAQRIGVQIEQLTWMIASGFQTAITVFVGQNFGARAYHRIRKAILYTAMVLVPYAMIIMLILSFFPRGLMAIFLDGSTTIAHGVVYLKIIAFAQVFMVIESICTGFFNGIARSYISSVISVIGNGLRIPLVIELSNRLGVKGIWWSLNISSILKAIVLLFLFVIFFQRLEKVKVIRKQAS